MPIPGLDSRYASVRARIESAVHAAGRTSESITLIAVSKLQPFEAIQHLYVKHGHRDFGENYAQELQAKATQATASGLAEIRWHFIGHVQTNKAKLIVPHVDAIHTIDSIRLAEAVSKRWRELSEARPPIRCFVEVNLDAEPTKAGVAPELDTIRAIWEALGKLPGLQAEGLMAIPEPMKARAPSPAFPRLVELATQLGALENRRLALSMGMSADLEAAIAAGATHVRVGTDIFGPRPT